MGITPFGRGVLDNRTIRSHVYTKSPKLSDMPTRTHSVDPRAERVRALLRDAAFELAHERSVDEITVSDLVDPSRRQQAGLLPPLHRPGRRRRIGCRRGVLGGGRGHRG